MAQMLCSVDGDLYSGADGIGDVVTAYNRDIVCLVIKYAYIKSAVSR